MMSEQTPVQSGDSETGKIKSITAGLFESDHQALQNLAEEMSLSRSQLVRVAVQNLLQRYQTGEISLTTEEGALRIQAAAQITADEPALKISKKKKKQASKKGKKKKNTKPARKKK